MVDMETFSIGEFIGITVFLFGGASYLMGQALADTWRSIWWNIPYGIMLAGGNHFIEAALFSRGWSNWQGYLIGLVVILLFSFLAYRITLVGKMIRQYPWIYERSGFLSWRKK